jgi:leucyl aminopeptidase (aminopeptidase T)
MHITTRLTAQDSIRPLTPHEQRVTERIFEQNVHFTPRDTVVIVTDPTMHEKEAALWFETAKTLGLPVELYVLAGMTHSGEEPPQTIVDLADTNSIVIFQTVYSLTHTKAGKKAISNGGRGISLPGAEYELLLRTLDIDYAPVRELGEKLKEALAAAPKLTITAQNGTHLTTQIRTTGIINDSGFFKPGELGNLPAGEVFFAPLLGTTNGTVVIDGSIADDVLDAPITVTIQNGTAVAMTGGAAAQKLWEKLNAYGPDGRTVAEVGIGTNPAAKITENLLEAEKAYGTVHIAFGNSSAIGGENDVPIHIDGLIAQPMVKTPTDLLLENHIFNL